MIVSLNGYAPYLCGYIPVFYPSNDDRFAASGITGEAAAINAEIADVNRQIKIWKSQLDNLVTAAFWGIPGAANNANIHKTKLNELNARLLILAKGSTDVQYMIDHPADLATFERQDINQASEQVPANSASSTYSFSAAPFQRAASTPNVANSTTEPQIPYAALFEIPAIAMIGLAILKKRKSA